MTNDIAKVHPRRRRRKRKRARHHRAVVQALPVAPAAPLDLRTAVQRLRLLNQNAS